MDGYTAGEIVWLLSLSHREALWCDADPRPQVLHGADESSSTADEGDHIPVIARWADVQRARRLVMEQRGDMEMARLLAHGYSQREIAERLPVSQSMVHRRMRATVRELLDVLGEASEPAPALAHPTLCLTCGERPRARFRAYRRRVGDERVLVPERQASVCLECLAPERRLLADLERALDAA